MHEFTQTPTPSQAFSTTADGRAVNQGAARALAELVELAREEIEEEDVSAGTAGSAVTAIPQLPQRFPKTFPRQLYDTLPEALKAITDVLETDIDRDVFLSGALPVLAGHMPNVEGVHGDGLIDMTLLSVIVAPAGSGKGALRYARALGSPLHRRESEEYRVAVQRWEAEDPKSRGERPALRALYIGGNASSRGIVDALQAVNGPVVMLESEIATVMGSWGNSEWGAYRDLLLKSFEGESCQLTRKGGDVINIERPALSVALSGTPDAARRLIPTVEDGLLSRLCLYTFSAPAVWRDQRPTRTHRDRDAHINETGHLLLSLRDELHNRETPLEVEWTGTQWDKHARTFAPMLADSDRESMTATVKRLGKIAFRIGCILTILRRYEEGVDIGHAGSLEVDDRDAETGLRLATSFYRHALHFAAELPGRPGSGLRLTEVQRQWLDAWPSGEVDKGIIVNIAHAFKVPVRTCEDWLKRLAGDDDTYPIVRVRRGVYRKTCGIAEVAVTAVTAVTPPPYTTTTTREVKV